MKVSELIEYLESHIDMYGDGKVVFVDAEYSQESENMEVFHYKNAVELIMKED